MSCAWQQACNTEEEEAAFPQSGAGTLSQCVLDNSTLLRQKDSPSAVKITYWALCNTVGYYTSDVDFPLFIALQTHKEKGGGHGRTGCHSCFNITNIDRRRLGVLRLSFRAISPASIKINQEIQNNVFLSNQSIKTGETFEIKCLFCVKFTITICDHGPQNQS